MIDYWQESSASTAIPLPFTSDAVGQHKYHSFDIEKYCLTLMTEEKHTFQYSNSFLHFFSYICDSQMVTHKVLTKKNVT